ncbi:tyrosine-protein phosphatase [Kalamiella sp. sgz302252]|uniref:tyrosine-protein phosphatase n=1 Tax=Pantoea sp. sgz302252 TaxID=3341827 RepID=UPI0036D3ED41
MKSLANTRLLRCSKNVLRLEWPACSQQNISVFELSLDDPAFCRRIGEGKTGLTIHCSDYYKPYFLLKAPDEEAILSERVLPLEGAYNFRDLGGYETDDGRYVKWGNLYRSDHLARLTQDDLHYLGSLRLKSNIDYRTLAEAAKQPNCMPEGVTTYRFIPDAASAELAAKAASDADKVAHLLTLAKINSGVMDGSGLLMLEQYRSFVTSEASLAAYRNMLNLIADPENLPVNQHCRGGKDRTGFGAALILTLLGVRKESVFKDFMMTGELRKYRNRQRMAAYRQETSNPQVLAFLSSIMETREAWLAAAFDEIDLRYGSFNRYLTQGLGITPTTIEQIKSLLLAKK